MKYFFVFTLGIIGFFLSQWLIFDFSPEGWVSMKIQIICYGGGVLNCWIMEE